MRSPVIISASFLLFAVACSSGSKSGPSGVGGYAGGGALGGSGGSGGSAGSGLGGSAGSGGSAGGSDGKLVGVLDAAACTPPVAGGQCDTFPQCGCSIGQKCDVVELSTGRTQCVQDGAVLPYHGCSSFLGNCLAGHTCVAGVCKPFCETRDDCPGERRECSQVTLYLDGVNPSDVPGMKTCNKPCDPVAPDVDCGSGLSCAFIDGSLTDCQAAGSGTGVGACAGGTLCAPGYVCVDNQGSSDCLKWCRVGNPNDCPSGQSCGGLTTTPSIGEVRYGVCF